MIHPSRLRSASPAVRSDASTPYYVIRTRAFGDRCFYVGVTRASHELCIYTNDKAAAARAVTLKQDKTSAVETIQRYERARERMADRGVGHGPVSLQQHNDIQR